MIIFANDLDLPMEDFVDDMDLDDSLDNTKKNSLPWVLLVEQSSMMKR